AGRARRRAVANGRCGSRRTAQRGGALRGAFPPGALGDSITGLPAYTAAESSTFAEKYFIARSQYLPVLRADFPQFGIDVGSCSAALERWAIVVGESGGV